MSEERDDVVERLGDAIDEWNTRITQTQAQLARHLALANERLKHGPETPPPSNEIEVLRWELSVRDERIGQLQGELDAARGQCDRLRDDLEQRAEIEVELQRVLDERNAARDELRGLREELEMVRAASTIAKSPSVTPPVSTTSRQRILGLENIVAFTPEGHKKRMGEIMVEAGVLTREQLDVLLREQRANPQRRFGHMVVEMGFSTEGVIGRIVAAQARLRYSDLSDQDFDPAVAALVTAAFATQRQCIPMRRDGDTLLLAMANPFDLITIDDVELSTGCRIEPVVATPAAIEFNIARFCPRS